MVLSPEATAGPRVMVVGKDPLITRTLTKLLGLDDGIAVLGAAPSIVTAPIAELRPDIIILDQAGGRRKPFAAQAYLDQVAPSTKLCALEALGGMTVTEVLRTIKHLARDYGASAEDARHLELRKPGGRTGCALLALRARTRGRTAGCRRAFEQRDKFATLAQR